MFVTPTAMAADDLRKQLPERKVVERKMVVVSPDQHPSGRFDLIVVTDGYQRMQHFESDTRRERNKQWFRDSVTTRLSGPDAGIVFL